MWSALTARSVCVCALLCEGAVLFFRHLDKPDGSVAGRARSLIQKRYQERAESQNIA
jgi:hypothetical protein